jgi:phosphoribosylamine--glycine ligase
MLILVIDPSGLTLDWCLRCVNAGHTVKLYTKGSRASHIGQGLVDKVDNWRAYVKVADLIFSSDNLEFMDEIQELQDKGYPVFGPGKKSAKLELNRMYGQQVIEAFGGPTIPSFEFKNYEQAIKFVKENPKRYVSKPCGEEEDKTLSYVAKDEADMIGFLTKRKEKGKGSPYFILQEFKPGVEIAVTGIFGPGGWVDYWCEGFEFKKQMNGDLGVNTGEMGTVTRYTKTSKLADMLMKPMEEELKKIGYVGMLDMNCIVDEKDGTPWPMEWTARPGYPMWNIMQPLMDNDDPAEWMLDIIKGNSKTFKAKEGTCVGVVMANSDFPFNKKDEEDYLDFPVLTDDVSDSEIDNLHPCEMKLTSAMKMMGEKLVEGVPEWGTAGSYILVCTGTGSSISEAKDKAYELVKKVKLGNDPQYRTDIGEKCEKALVKLRKFGFCTGWKY